MHEIALLTIQLEEAAHHDHLTGLLTRMRFFQRANEEADALFPASLLLIDIDHFKAVNDRHGHAAGDKALQVVSRTISRNCRLSDLTARYGGEEFVLLMPGSTESQGAKAANRIRRKLAHTPVPLVLDELTVTASFGVAEVLSADQLEEAMRRADAALYQAKENGRDRVVRAAQPPNFQPHPGRGEPQPIGARRRGDAA